MEKLFRACFNWKVIGGLALLGLGIWFVSPNLLAAALPVLLLAACPLSMLVMMRSMQGHEGSRSEGRSSRVVPSADVRLAELKALREAIDREIVGLEEGSERPAPGPAASPRGSQGTTGE